MRKLSLFIGILIFGLAADAQGRTGRLNPPYAWSSARHIIKHGWPGTKPWWASKTLWFNLFAATLVLAEQNVESLKGMIPARYQVLFVLSLPFINMWLRMITSQRLLVKAQLPQSDKEGP